jgi:hypothetical protein
MHRGDAESAEGFFNLIPSCLPPACRRSATGRQRWGEYFSGPYERLANGKFTQAVKTFNPSSSKITKRNRSMLVQAIQKTAQKIDVGDDSDQPRILVDHRKTAEFIVDKRGNRGFQVVLWR